MDDTSPRITGVVRREETVLRLGGVGDNWHMTWGADDRQYVGMCDGWGWPGMPWYDLVNGQLHSRVYAILGTPPEVTFEYLPGYPDLPTYLDTETSHWSDDPGAFYGFGTLSVGGRIYQYLSTRNHPRSLPDGTRLPGYRFVGAKLIYSPDGGETWHNQDGSTPVVWDAWADQSRDTMVFYDEPQESFSLLTMLQMGRDYSANRDGYVYVYAPNGNTDGTMNELVMFRAPIDGVLDRGSHEYFAGGRPDGGADWTRRIEERGVVHTFSRGWVNTNDHAYAWQPSVVYVEALECYLMANWGMGCGPDGGWFGKPSYLGFYVARTPWGPWEQIHEETAWLPAGDPGARCYQPQIAPKWIAEDGRSFWLVWTDFASSAAGGDQVIAADADVKISADTFRRGAPYYSFNAQRVDLRNGR